MEMILLTSCVNNKLDNNEIIPTITRISILQYIKYQSESPKGKYLMEIGFTKTPLILYVKNNVDSNSFELNIANQKYTNIMKEKEGIFWSQDEKWLMFIIYNSLNLEINTRNNSCIVVIDLENKMINALITTPIPYNINYYDDKEKMLVLEHGGNPNNIFDYYYPETKCYKYIDEGECNNIKIEE